MGKLNHTQMKIMDIDSWYIVVIITGTKWLFPVYQAADVVPHVHCLIYSSLQPSKKVQLWSPQVVWEKIQKLKEDPVRYCCNNAMSLTAKSQQHTMGSSYLGHASLGLQEVGCTQLASAGAVLFCASFTLFWTSGLAKTCSSHGAGGDESSKVKHLWPRKS